MKKTTTELFYAGGLVLFGGMMSVMMTGCPPAEPVVAPPEPTSVAWEQLERSYHRHWRTPVPGGWLVASGDGHQLFLADKDHEWLKPKVEVENVDYIKLYLAADRATLEAVRPALLEYDHVSEESHRPSDTVRLLDAWEKRIDAAEAHQ